MIGKGLRDRLEGLLFGTPAAVITYRDVSLTPPLLRDANRQGYRGDTVIQEPERYGLDVGAVAVTQAFWGEEV